MPGNGSGTKKDSMFRGVSIKRGDLAQGASHMWAGGWPERPAGARAMLGNKARRMPEGSSVNKHGEGTIGEDRGFDGRKEAGGTTSSMRA